MNFSIGAEVHVLSSSVPPGVTRHRLPEVYVIKDKDVAPRGVVVSVVHGQLKEVNLVHVADMYPPRAERALRR